MIRAVFSQNHESLVYPATGDVSGPVGHVRVAMANAFLDVLHAGTEKSLSQRDELEPAHWPFPSL